MIPASNSRHVVVGLPFDRIDDLIDAARDAGILPRSMPADGQPGEHVFRIPRFDSDITLQYLLTLDAPLLRAFPGAAGDVVRLGMAVPSAAIRMALVEKSTGRELTYFQAALAGRVAITGVLGVDGGTRSAFFHFLDFRFLFDDFSNGIPLPLPRQALEQVISRIANREIRAKLAGPTGLPEKRFPVSTAIDRVANIPHSLGLAFRAPSPGPDSFEVRRCLPAGGDPTCAIGAPSARPFYELLEFYAALQPATAPNPANRLGRQFQVDIGVDVLNRILQEISHQKQFNDSREKAIFRVEWNVRLSVRPWPGSASGDASIFVDAELRCYMRVPKIRWCRKKVFGHWVSYPCGVSLEWARLKTITGRVHVRPFVNGTNLCAERSDVDIDQDTTILGYLFEFFVGATLSIILPGPAVAWGMFMVVIMEFLDEIMESVINSAAPNQLCYPIQDYLSVPAVRNRIDLLLSRPLLEFKTSGLSLASDGDFQRI